MRKRERETANFTINPHYLEFAFMVCNASIVPQWTLLKIPNLKIEANSVFYAKIAQLK